MSGALLSLTTYVVNAFWQVPLIAAAGWCLARCLRRTGPEFQHKIWVAVLILATLAPATPVFQQYFAHQTQASAVLVSSRSSLTPAAGAHVSLTSAHIVLPPTAVYAISGVYIASVIFFLFRLCWLIRCTSALVRHARPASLEPDHMAMWNRTTQSYSVQTASLLHSDDIPGPVTAGFRRPVLLLPVTFIEEHTPTEFLAAIGHECAHIQRSDFCKNVLYEVVALATAFHPVTWFIKSHIVQTREMVCDRMAAEQLLDRQSYGRSLLQLAAKMPTVAPSAVFHTVGMFHNNILERRVMTVMTALPRVTKVRRYVLGVSATLLLSTCAGVSGWFTQPVAAQTPKPPAQQKQKARPNLECYYYDDKTVAHPGTCGRDKQDRNRYLCYLDSDPSISQLQTACEWKVLRAEEAEK